MDGRSGGDFTGAFHLAIPRGADSKDFGPSQMIIDRERSVISITVQIFRRGLQINRCGSFIRACPVRIRGPGQRMVSQIPSVHEAGRDRSAKRKNQKPSASSYQFPILDFLVLAAIIRCEQSSAQVTKSVSDLCAPSMLPPTNTIRSRLNSLTHKGFLSCRTESNGRQLYFNITDKGKGRLREMCKLIPPLNAMARIAGLHLTRQL